MRPISGLVWGCALAALAAVATPAHAGWNNVFQVCCNHCGGTSAPPVVSNYSADPGAGCCQPPPTQTCTTRYIQRTYYQPVTSYRQSTYYQPVTSYRTSYYYEPVCSYRYSCYYDPCTCSYQTVATPTTSYRLRSQCNPVTSYLQRTCMTPVTTYRASCYYEPVTTCCQTSTGAPVTSVPPGADVNPAPSTPAPPGTSDRSGDVPPPAPPGTSEKRSPDALPPGGMPPASEMRRGNTRPPVVRYDRIASREGSNQIAGRLVGNDRNPLSSAKVLFVSVEKKTVQRTATTDRDGKFEASLDEGGWLVYTYDRDGKPVFSRRVEVSGGRSAQFTLVSR